jgi:thiol:disulfide interchange protein
MKKSRMYIMFFIIITLIVAIGFLFFNQKIINTGTAPVQQNQQQNSIQSSLWQTAELEDVKTQEIFTIKMLNDKPILLESFAVWCPKCKQQQDILKDFQAGIGDAAVIVSLDTDPNEDENKVIEHVNRYSYSWVFAVSPEAVTQSLIKDFGTQIISAPSTPVILLCPEKQPRLLKTGIKTASELKQEIENC